MNDPNLSSFIWSVADLLRGDYKQSENGRVILPFTVLRRLDCVLEKTESAVLTELASRDEAGLNPEPFLLRKSGQHFFNTSLLDMKKLGTLPPGSHQGKPVRLHSGVFARGEKHLREASSFTFRSTVWRRRSCFIRDREVRQHRPSPRGR